MSEAAGQASDAAQTGPKAQNAADTVNDVKHLRDTRTGQFAVVLSQNNLLVAPAATPTPAATK